jgi:RimJ/RimL family protein N-acetyltransferase
MVIAMPAAARAPKQPALITPRLQLKAFTQADAAELHELFADPQTHTVGSGPFTSFAQTERWIANRLIAQRDHGLCWYALRDSASGRLIGNCGMLKGRASYGQPEIGYEIRASDRRQGYAAEAAQAVIEQCRTAGLARVWASIRPDNTGSRRIAAQLGMHIHRTESDNRGDLIFYFIDL